MWIIYGQMEQTSHQILVNQFNLKCVRVSWLLWVFSISDRVKVPGTSDSKLSIQLLLSDKGSNW